MTPIKTTRNNALPPVHPGIILRDHYLEFFGLEHDVVARDLGISEAYLDLLLSGCQDISPEMALRLSVYFKTSPEYWLERQARYSLACLRLEKGSEIQQQVRPFSEMMCSHG